MCVRMLASPLRSIDPLLPDKERLGKIVMDGKVPTASHHIALC